MMDVKINLEELVRTVMADLGLRPREPDGDARPAAEPAAPAIAPVAAASPPAADGRAPSDLVVHTRVVTLAQIGDRLDGVRRLVVPTGAVVTPAVRDELQRKNIGLDFERPTSGKAPSVLRLVMMVHGPAFDPALLSAALRAEGINIDPRQNDCVVRAIDELAGELSANDALGLVVTSYPAPALCLANRHRHLRAVWGIDAGRLAEDAVTVGANVLIVDPRQCGPFPLKQMATQFCRLGPGACPEALRERLA